LPSLLFQSSPRLQHFHVRGHRDQFLNVSNLVFASSTQLLVIELAYIAEFPRWYFNPLTPLFPSTLDTPSTLDPLLSSVISLTIWESSFEIPPQLALSRISPNMTWLDLESLTSMVACPHLLANLTDLKVLTLVCTPPSCLNPDPPITQDLFATLPSLTFVTLEFTNLHYSSLPSNLFALAPTIAYLTISTPGLYAFSPLAFGSRSSLPNLRQIEWQTPLSCAFMSTLQSNNFLIGLLFPDWTCVPTPPAVSDEPLNR
jgi:hypothetical protein